MRQPKTLRRIDDTRCAVPNPHGPEPTLFANSEVPIEKNAVEELQRFLELGQTLKNLRTEQPDFFGPQEPEICQVAVTPDFHKGAGVPIGTVLKTRGFIVPQAIGNDINCGMRVHLTGLKEEDVTGRLDELESELRYLFFEGGRDIPMTRTHREALFTEGLPGLFESVRNSIGEGLWPFLGRLKLDEQLDRIHSGGGLYARQIWGLDDFLGAAEGLSRDSQIGSIGGGNHFVELQTVDRVCEGTAAHAWGLRKGQVVVMVHTGSVMVGHLAGGYARRVVQQLFPSGLTHPENGVYVLPTSGPYQSETEIFTDALHNAANFAFANRMFLAVIALAALNKVCGETESSLLYDAPHNLVWQQDDESYLHRKGATPARGYQAMAGTPFAYTGEPVLVPGSMGASSFLLAGRGKAEALSSASHGAGRQLSRGQALKGHEAEFEDFLKHFRVVTPLDFRRADLKSRPEILQEKLADLKKEAPFAYKGIGAVIETLEQAQIAEPVVELKPLLTVKG